MVTNMKFLTEQTNKTLDPNIYFHEQMRKFLNGVLPENKNFMLDTLTNIVTKQDTKTNDFIILRTEEVLFDRLDSSYLYFHRRPTNRAFTEYREHINGVFTDNITTLRSDSLGITSNHVQVELTFKDVSPLNNDYIFRHSFIFMYKTVGVIKEQTKHNCNVEEGLLSVLRTTARTRELAYRSGSNFKTSFDLNSYVKQYKGDN